MKKFSPIVRLIAVVGNFACLTKGYAGLPFPLIPSLEPMHDIHEAAYHMGGLTLDGETSNASSSSTAPHTTEDASQPRQLFVTALGLQPDTHDLEERLFTAINAFREILTSPEAEYQRQLWDEIRTSSNARSMSGLGAILSYFPNELGDQALICSFYLCLLAGLRNEESAIELLNDLLERNIFVTMVHTSNVLRSEDFIRNNFPDTHHVKDAIKAYREAFPEDLSRYNGDY